MDIERARKMMLALPHVVETMQWGDNLVFWVGDKALGGKMFALADLDRMTLVASFAAGHERAAELCETEGFRPAPYFARIGWVAAERWDVVPEREWQRLLASAHHLVLCKLPACTRTALELPPKELQALVAERRRALAAAKLEMKPRDASRAGRTGAAEKGS